MITHPKQLLKTIEYLTKHGAHVYLDSYTISINIDITKTNTDFVKLKPYLYFILNKFEDHYFILIEGIPYCLLPDATSHMVYTAQENVNYQHTNSCKQCKLYNTCPGWENGHKIKTVPPPVMDTPNEIVLEITRKCNLRCTVCFSEHSSKDMPLQKIKDIIDECIKQGVKAVRFHGGEPLLHKDACEALYYAKSKNLHVIINTNATVLTNKIQQTLANTVDDCLVSLQGYNAESEKHLTKSPFPFNRKLHNMVSMNSRLKKFRVGTIISKTLIQHFDQYYHLIAKLNIRSWELYRPLLIDDKGEFDISKKDLLWLMKRIKKLKLSGFNLKITSPLPYCMSDDFELSKYVLVGGGAEDGHTRIVADVDGFFKPSYFMSENLGETIENSWKNPLLNKIRSVDYLPQKCHDCDYLQWCKGGSRSLSKLLSDSYFKQDPLMNLT